MSKKSAFDGVIVNRETSPEGFVHAYDKNGRSCWGAKEPERVVLTADLRTYAPDLFIGQLGWTVPGTTDGYKQIDVQFDNGPRFPVFVYAIARIPPERAHEIAARLVAENRNTRFDADQEVARRCHRQWINTAYQPYVNIDLMVELGVGDEEVYAFTFPSLIEAAKIKNDVHYLVKVGYTSNKDAGAIDRIRGLMFDATAHPEKATVLSVCKTWSGRALEVAVHRWLCKEGRHVKTAPGAEWFKTNAEEVVRLFKELAATVPKPQSKPLRGASPLLEDVLQEGDQIEVGQDPQSACVSIRIVKERKQE